MDPKEILEEWQESPTNKAAVDRTREIRVPSHHPALVALVGSVAGKSYPLADRVSIGRGVDCDIQLSAFDISREHARVLRDGRGRYLIEDLKSVNGTMVDGAPISEPTLLRYGSRIQLGTSTVLMLTHHSPLEDRLVEQEKLEAVGRVADGVATEFARVLGELRDGLAGIRAAARGPLGASELLDRLTPLDRTVSEALEITQQLLAFARPSRPTHSEVDLGAVIASVIRLVTQGVGGRLECSVAIDEVLIIRGDALQLQQVLMGLCLHGRDSVAALDSGEIRIRAKLMGGPTHAGAVDLSQQVLVAISDNGPGMDEQLRQQIFEPYLSSHTARAGRPGLAAAYAIVKNHNGHLEVDSEPGKGTLFRLYLPVGQDSSDLSTVSALPTVKDSPPA